MCGIAGGIGPSAPSKLVLYKQLDSIKHRGPDDQGTYVNQGIALGMCRLAIVEIADLVDKRYPIKGMDVWKPYGLSTMRLIDGLTRQEMASTGHEEYNFPLLVPEDLLDKENRLVSRLKAARELGIDPLVVIAQISLRLILRRQWPFRLASSQRRFLRRAQALPSILEWQ